MSAFFSCDTGLYYYDCGGDNLGCCSVNDVCSQYNGCLDEANDECNGQGQTPCGVLCCPDDSQCEYVGYCAAATETSSPPSSTPTVTSTRTLISTIPYSKISTTTGTSASKSDSTTDISTEGAASIASPSSSPSSQLGPTTKVTSLLTSTTTSSPGNATLVPSSSLASSSSSKSHGAAIGGSIGAVVGLVLAACLIRWLIVGRRRKTSGDKRKAEGSDEPQLQGTADNGERGAFDTGNGTNEKTDKSTKSSILTMLSPIRRRRAKHSSQPEPGPLYAEMPEPNGNVSNPELPSDSPADQIAELPAQVERVAFQAPGRASESNWTDVNSNAGTVEAAGESLTSPGSPMSPNLDVGEARRGRSVNRDEHVLSFMNYNDQMPSPVR